MLPVEKERLLMLFAEPARWCQGAEARDEAGNAVRYDDPSAVAWDITGGLCALFGWQRALELFPQLDRHVHQVGRGRRRDADPGIASMAALQDSNDEAATTFETVTGWLKTMPVWDAPREDRCGAQREAPGPDAVYC